MTLIALTREDRLDVGGEDPGRLSPYEEWRRTHLRRDGQRAARRARILGRIGEVAQRGAGDRGLSQPARTPNREVFSATDEHG